MNQLVAGRMAIMSMMSSPLKFPVRPRKLFSVSSWSSGRYSNCQSILPEGQIESRDARTLIYLSLEMVHPVKALAQFLTSSSV